LRREKGFDLLLEAFARIAKLHPSWSLTIWGEGPERKSLDALACKLAINDRVSLPGNTHEPLRQLAAADLFVLSSRVEGFPNALTEAMSMGLPVIATDVGAVSEIVEDGVTGMLVPPEEVDSLATAMDRLMADEAQRCSLGGRAPEVLERFSLESVMEMWDDVVESVTAGRRTSVGCRSLNKWRKSSGGGKDLSC
jgi:glycosyltransferase involved in cell wall biosynthesis